MVAARGSALAARRALSAIANKMAAPHRSDTGPVRFRDLQYHLIITNAGSPDAFTVKEWSSPASVDII